ncbi:hypothetical protein MBR_05612, partial [Metarhizium brunneum ARSEF 3297]
MWAGQVGMGVAVDKRRERDISVWWDADADQAQDEAAAGHTKATPRPHADQNTQPSRRHADADTQMQTWNGAQHALHARGTEDGIRSTASPRKRALQGNPV